MRLTTAIAQAQTYQRNSDPGKSRDVTPPPLAQPSKPQPEQPMNPGTIRYSADCCYNIATIRPEEPIYGQHDYFC